MVHDLYRFDGKGYESWLAESADLLHWKTLGRIMSFTDGTWDATQKAGYIALQDTEWGGRNAPEPFEGYYWMSYIGGSATGYEAGKLGIGIAAQTPAEAGNGNDCAAPYSAPRIPTPAGLKRTSCTKARLSATPT